MQVSQTRFDLTPTEERGIDAFKDYLFHNSECCSHCFQRVREIDEQKIKRGKNAHIEDVWEYHERTDWGVNEYTPWDRGSQRQYGTTFCLDCGSDLSADHHLLTLEELKPIARNIYRYTAHHTPLSLDHKRFGREIRELKRDDSNQGRESQILAVAFARALTGSRATTGSTVSAD